MPSSGDDGDDSRRRSSNASRKAARPLPVNAPPVRDDESVAAPAAAAATSSACVCVYCHRSVRNNGSLIRSRAAAVRRSLSRLCRRKFSSTFSVFFRFSHFFPHFRTRAFRRLPRDIPRRLHASSARVDRSRPRSRPVPRRRFKKKKPVLYSVGVECNFSFLFFRTTIAPENSVTVRPAPPYTIVDNKHDVNHASLLRIRIPSAFFSHHLAVVTRSPQVSR